MQPELPIQKMKTHHAFFSRQSHSTLWAHTDLNRLLSPQLFPLCSHFLSKGFLPFLPPRCCAAAICARKMARPNHYSDQESMTVLSPGKQ